MVGRITRMARYHAVCLVYRPYHLEFPLVSIPFQRKIHSDKDNIGSYQYCAVCRYAVLYGKFGAGFGKLCCQPCRSCKPYSNLCHLPSARNAAGTFRRTVNELTVPTSAPQKQDASKRRQECVSTEKRSDSKTLCNELASEMP